MTGVNTSRTVEDELEIRQLVATFALAAIHRDYPTFTATWATEGRWRISPPIDVEFVTRSTIGSVIPEMLARWAWFIQIPHSGVVTVDGDRGSGQWIMSERARPASGEGGHRNEGLYEDQYIREDGRWRFLSRTYRYLYIDSSAPAGEGFPATR
jgi:SnoaL-like domain